MADDSSVTLKENRNGKAYETFACPSISWGVRTGFPILDASTEACCNRFSTLKRS
jgi:hypothetical protein